MRMTQTTANYPKYDDNILEGTKSTETKQVLKDKTWFWKLKKTQSKWPRINI